MATDPTVKISVNRQQRQVATQSIGVRGADMGVANSIAAEGAAQQQMANTAFGIAQEKRQDEAYKDLRKVKDKDLIIRDPETGAYKSSVTNLLGQYGKGKGSIYNRIFEAGLYKQFNDSFEREITKKSSEYLRKHPANSVMYASAMQNYFDTTSKNFSEAELGAFDAIFQNSKMNGIEYLKDESFKLRLKANSMLLKQSLISVNNDIKAMVKGKAVDFTKFWDEGGELFKISSDAFANSKEIFSELGGGSVIALPDSIVKKDMKVSANNSAAEVLISELHKANINSDQTKGGIRDLVIGAIGNQDLSYIPEDAVIAINGKDVNIREAVGNMLETALATNSTQDLVATLNAADNMSDATEASLSADERIRESIAEGEARENAINDVNRITSEIEEHYNLEGKISRDNQGQLSNRFKGDFNDRVGLVQDFISRIDDMQSTRIAGTNRNIMDTTTANNLKRDLRANLARDFNGRLSASGISSGQISTVAQHIRNGTIPNYPNAKTHFKRLNKEIKSILTSDTFKNLDIASKDKIVSDIVTQRRLRDDAYGTAQQNQVNAKQAYGTGNLDNYRTEKGRKQIQSVLRSLASEDNSEKGLSEEQQGWISNNTFFDNYNRNVHGPSSYYDNAINLAREHNFVIPELKNSLERAFGLGGTQTTDKGVLNGIEAIDNIVTVHSDLTVTNPLLNIDGMEGIVDVYRVLQSVRKTQQVSSLATVVRTLTGDESAEKIAEGYSKFDEGKKEDKNFKSGRSVVEKLVNSTFKNSPSARAIMNRSMDYWVAVSNKHDYDALEKWVEDASSNFFVSSEGTVPVISHYDKATYDGEGETKSFLSINRVITKSDMRSAFNAWVELDLNNGLASATNGQYSFFNFDAEGISRDRQGLVSVDMDEIKPSISIPLFDAGPPVNPAEDYSVQAGGIKRAILVAHPTSSTDVGKMVQGRYTNDIVYFAYEIQDSGELKMLYKADDSRSPIMFNIKDFMNQYQEGLRETP